VYKCQIKEDIDENHIDDTVLTSG